MSIELCMIPKCACHCFSYSQIVSHVGEMEHNCWRFSLSEKYERERERVTVKDRHRNYVETVLKRYVI